MFNICAHSCICFELTWIIQFSHNEIIDMETHYKLSQAGPKIQELDVDALIQSRQEEKIANEPNRQQRTDNKSSGDRERNQHSTGTSTTNRDTSKSKSKATVLSFVSSSGDESDDSDDGWFESWEILDYRVTWYKRTHTQVYLNIYIYICIFNVYKSKALCHVHVI